jgi:hypothetical protein
VEEGGVGVGAVCAAGHHHLARGRPRGGGGVVEGEDGVQGGDGTRTPFCDGKRAGRGRTVLER